MPEELNNIDEAFEDEDFDSEDMLDADADDDVDEDMDDSIDDEDDDEPEFDSMED